MTRARGPSALLALLAAAAMAPACSHRSSGGHAPTPHADAAHAAPHDAAAVVPAGPTGTIEGTIFLDGPLRPGTPVTLPAAFHDRPGCRDAALRYSQTFDITSPGPMPGALASVEAPEAAPAAPRDRVMSFRDCDINPRVLFASRHDRILFHLDSRLSHVPHILGAASPIDQVLIPGQQDQVKQFPHPGRYAVTVRTMPDFVQSYLFVLPNRFLDQADSAGHFRVTDVPVGNRLVHAWYPGAQEARQVVAVAANETAHVELHLHELPPQPATPPTPLVDSGIPVPP